MSRRRLRSSIAIASHTGSSGNRGPHVGRIGEIEPEQAQQPPHPRLVDVRRDCKGRSACALASASRPTCHTQCASSISRSGAMDTSTPRKCAIQSSSTRAQRSRAPARPRLRLIDEIVALVARPVRRAVLDVEHVEIDGACRRAVLRQELAQRAEAAARREHLDGHLVGRHHGAILGDGDLLRPKQHLGGARRDRVGVLAEHVPQHHLRQLVRRTTAARRRRRLETARRTPPRANRRRRDGRESAARSRNFRARRRRRAPQASARVDRAPRLGQQRIVQRELVRARLRRSARARAARGNCAGNRRSRAARRPGRAQAGGSPTNARNQAPPSIAFFRSACTGCSPTQIRISASLNAVAFDRSARRAVEADHRRRPDEVDRDDAALLRLAERLHDRGHFADRRGDRLQLGAASGSASIRPSAPRPADRRTGCAAG